MPQLFLNNFQTQFIAAVKAAPETATPSTELDYGILRVSDGAAGLLLNPGAGSWYVLTAFKRSGSAESDYEVLRVAAVDNSVVGECRLVVLRAQEGTTSKSYAAGDIVELRLTAGGMGEYVQDADSRMTDSRTPTGAAGGVLSGAYPNPGFAQAMATAAAVGLKEDKVAGKGLSANDYTNAEVAKLAGIAEQATKNATDAALRARSSHTGEQAIGTVTGLQAALDDKVVKVTGKGLSTEDFTAVEKSKLLGIATSATANDSDVNLKARGNHTGTQAIDTVAGLQTALDGKVAVDGAKVLSTNDYTTAEKNKLEAIAAGATANQPDAALKDRANHIGTQIAATISDFAATVRATILTGLSTAINTNIAAADSILVALGKLQGQLILSLRKANDTATNLTLTGGVKEPFAAQVSPGATKTIVLADGCIQDILLTANLAVTLPSPSNGAEFSVRYKQNGTGGWSVTHVSTGTVHRFPNNQAADVNIAATANWQTLVSYLSDGVQWYISPGTQYPA